MEQQITYTQRPRGSTGGKVFLILEMLVMILVQLSYFIATLFPDDAASNIPILKVIFWIVFFTYMTGYILLIIGTSNRNSIGLLIAGFALFLLLEWESVLTSATSLSSFLNRLKTITLTDRVIIYSFTFVWICMIVLACIKKAPKPLCLIPGIIGILTSILLLYSQLMNISMWGGLNASTTDGKEFAYTLFIRISVILNVLVIIFRPFWIFMVSHWMTHPTIKVAVRPTVTRMVQQPATVYVPVQPQPYQPVQAPAYQPVQQPVYQPVPQQGYQQVPQQYPGYGQPPQYPPQQ